MYLHAIENPEPGAVVMQGGRAHYLAGEWIAPSEARLADSASFTRRNPNLGCNRACGVRQLCRLGAGTVVGQEVGGSIMQIAPLTGPAAPFVALGGELVKIFSEFFGGGCGQACIQSAKLEQVPEAACDSLQAVAALGMLNQADYMTAIQQIINYGTQQLQNLLAKGDSRAQGGITNLAKSTSGNVAYGQTMPTLATKPLDLGAAQAVFLNASTPGWYSDSIVAGNQLALQVLQSIAANQASSLTGGGTASAVSGTVAALSSKTGIPALGIYAGFAALIWVLIRK